MSALERQCPKQYQRLLSAGSQKIRKRKLGSHGELILEGKFECQECHKIRWVSGLSAGTLTKNTRGRCCGTKPGLKKLEEGGFIGKTGPEHQNWKGGRSTREDGYVLISVPPSSPYASMCATPSSKGGYRQIFEHRLIMAQHLGRLLQSGEVVHHKDGNPSNNLIENLQLLSKSEHTALEQRLIKEKILRLETENAELKKENERLKNACAHLKS